MSVTDVSGNRDYGRGIEMWKSLYSGKTGAARFRAADADEDGQVSFKEAKTASVPVERHGGRRRFEHHAGEDGNLSLEEARHGRDQERQHRTDILHRLKDLFA